MPKRSVNIFYLETLKEARDLFSEELARHRREIELIQEYFDSERNRIALLQRNQKLQKFKPIYLRLEVGTQKYADWPRADLLWCVGTRRTRKDGSTYWSSRRFAPSGPDGNYSAKDIKAMIGKRGWYYELVRAAEKQVQPIRRHIRGFHEIYVAISKCPEFPLIQTKNFFNYVRDEQ